MTDARLRELERRQAASPADEAALLLARVRTGALTRERLELAARCGQPAARAACGEPADADHPLLVAPSIERTDAWVEAVAGRFGEAAALRVAMDVAWAAATTAGEREQLALAERALAGEAVDWPHDPPELNEVVGLAVSGSLAAHDEAYLEGFVSRRAGVVWLVSDLLGAALRTCSAATIEAGLRRSFV